MPRFLLLPLLLVVGCLGEDNLAQDARMQFKEVEMPADSAATVEVAERVERVGKTLIAQNPFLGVDPAFQTLGKPESEIFHPDLGAIFITQGMVERCETDDQLAAVLAKELVAMNAEVRAGKRFELATSLEATPSSTGQGFGSDPQAVGTQYVIDQQKKKTAHVPNDDADEHILTLLDTAGYNKSAYSEVTSLLQQAGRNHSLANQLSKPSLKPQWTY